MRAIVRPIVVAAAALVLGSPHVHGQERTGLMGDLLRDIEQVEKKVVGLARAMPAAAYEYRPGQGVRSTAEVFLHIAADNYFLPAILGMAPPADTGINGKDYKTTVAYEKRSMTRDQVIAELEKSFTFLKASMRSMPDDKLDASVDMFGQKSTNRGVWLTTAVHLHEHLGQLIAYARANNVTPPWSK